MTHNGYTRDAHRYLDGEPHGALTAEEARAADALRRASTELAARLQGPDAAFDGRVMAKLRVEGRPSRSAWSWLLEPRTVSVRPVWIPLAAAAALAVWLALPRSRPMVMPDAPMAAAILPDTVWVRFELSAPQARRVHLAGDFNRWEPEAVPLVRRADGTWSVTVPLNVGEHRYQFVLDGSMWVPDPSTDAVDDGFGGRNSVIVVSPRGVVRS